MALVERLAVVDKPAQDTKFLGQLLWYTVTDLEITRNELEQIFSSVGLDQAHLPNEIKPVDAFRRATSAAEAKRLPHAKDQFINLLVREVRSDDSEVVRHLVREVVDSNNVRLHYQEVATLSLSRGDGKMKVFPWPPATEAERTACHEAQVLYEKFRQSYNGRHLREVVHDILETTGPVAVRPSGGVYFVPQQHEATIEKLKALVERLANYGTTGQRSKLYTVPVIDLVEQRKMVEESLVDQVGKESHGIIAEAAEILKSGKKVTTSLAQGLAERTRKLAGLTAQYEELLEQELTTVRSTLELARLQATALLGKVDVA